MDDNRFHVYFSDTLEDNKLWEFLSDKAYNRKRSYWIKYLARLGLAVLEANKGQAPMIISNTDEIKPKRTRKRSIKKTLDKSVGADAVIKDKDTPLPDIEIKGTAADIEAEDPFLGEEENLEELLAFLPKIN